MYHVCAHVFGVCVCVCMFVNIWGGGGGVSERRELVLRLQRLIDKFRGGGGMGGYLKFRDLLTQIFILH